MSLTRTVLAAGETQDIFGKSPHGYITYGRGRRMSVLLVSGERPKPATLEAMTDPERAALFRTMAAYGGTFTVESSTVTHHIEVSWNQIYSGTNQVRN